MGHRMPALAAALLLAAAQALPAAAAAEAPAKEKAAPGRNSLFGDFSQRGRGEPISVRSDTLEFSYKDHLLTYSGQVIVTQGDLTLKADVLKVTISDEGPGRLEQIIAVGGVEISQGKRSASGGRAVFNQRDRTIELSDGAVLTEGLNRISGERVIVYLDQERSVVEGGDKRVQALLYPGEDLGKVGRGADSGPP